MSVSPYSIARFLSFVLKNKKQKVLSHWYMRWRRWIGGCAIVFDFSHQNKSLNSCLLMIFFRCLSKMGMAGAAGSRLKHTLPDLPYNYNALEPVISHEIMELHHKKHHATYVNNFNVAEEKLAEAMKSSRYTCISDEWVVSQLKLEPRHEKTYFCHMRTTKVQISLRIHTVWSAPLLFAS